MCDIWDDPVALKRELSLENICVITDKPPILEDKDNDYLNYFNGRVDDGDNHGNNVPYENIDPAVFNEISDMLHMMKHNNEDDMTTSLHGYSSDEIDESEPIVISKLNPEVPEFQPRSSNMTYLTVTNEELEIKQSNGISILDSHDIQESSEIVKLDPIVSEYKTDIQKDNTKDKDKVNFKIIKNVPKKCSIKEKRIRNVAIANIMKLKSIDTSESETSLKLMKPSDFMKIADVPELPSTSNSLPSEKNLDLGKECLVLENKKEDLDYGNLELKKKDDVLVVKDTVSEEVKQPPEVTELPEVKISKRKVERWLDNKPMNDTPKSASPSNSLSYTVVKSNSQKTISPVPEPVGVKKFVPSSNSNIYMKYVKNTKVAIPDKNENIWTKLERQLKELDEKKLKELEAKSLNSC